ncbi:MAG: bifunctional phosphopantothenoylcysteine decarboxylase/phosphopantothenate synthase [Novosphingobium sp.]|nr:bifunctional phosphopantothenoylcysteine decarboxylase/phosphopantothenate synthase [Novosphingobium sp.]
MTAPRILLIVGGGIAAYKACELIRLIRKGGGSVSCVLTEGGAQFITPMTLAALSENPVYTTLWDLKNESEMGHIQLSREADVVVVCPATADLLAKMASGISDDLATTVLLATDKPVLAVPAMNVRMWEHEATQRNVEWLRRAGVAVMDPDEGAMACGEYGPGRLPEPAAVWQAIGGVRGFEVALPPADVPALPAVPPPVAHFREEHAPPEVWTEEAFEPEPEPEPEPEHKPGGLAGLFASIIPRTSPRKPVLEEEEFAPWPEPEDIAAADAETFEEFTEEAEEEPLPDPDLSGPLLARKGRASAAPPTDPEAINHEVNPMQTPPEAFEGEPPAVPVGEPQEVVDDALEGQGEFTAEPGHRPLAGKHVLITAGPTHEPIDPVRYIANRSSGRQGFAIAGWAAALGARVTLVAGPVSLATPPGVDRVDVETAVQMSDAVKKALPADIAVMVAAVADWRVDHVAEVKMKKREMAPPALRLTENPDILANLAAGSKRPGLIVGFAAETDNVIEYAKDKRKRKGADWIVANDVSGDVMGGTHNRVHLVTAEGVESWDDLPKGEVARLLVERIADEVE